MMQTLESFLQGASTPAAACSARSQRAARAYRPICSPARWPVSAGGDGGLQPAHRFPHRDARNLSTRWPAATRRRLAALGSAANDVQRMMVGSGSPANDVVAGQLASLGRPGIVVSTGNSVSAWRTMPGAPAWNFTGPACPGGPSLPPPTTRRPSRRSNRRPGSGWCTTRRRPACCMTCTALKKLSQDHRCKLRLDCISSDRRRPGRPGPGSTPGGRARSGKAIAGFPGLGIVSSTRRFSPSALIFRAISTSGSGPRPRASRSRTRPT